MIKSYPLVFAENYYIHKEGYIYRAKKEFKLQAYHTKDGIMVNINNKEYSLLNLMIEYFHRDKCDYKRIKVKCNRKFPLDIPARNIIFVYDQTHITFDSSDELLIGKYGCKVRAKSANKREINRIDEYDVISVLKKYNFRCRYCGKLLEKKKWHLDHIIPISLGGENIFDNLASTCSTCNLMKHNLPEIDFLNKCLRIVNYNNLKEALNG